MQGSSPTVAAWELMLRLRQQAEARGLKANAIAKALDISSQYWSLLTKGKGLLSEDKLQVLLKLLEFDTDERSELLALREAAKGRSIFAPYSALFSDTFMRFYGLEEGANSIRSFENAVIPGLLQTEDYTRVLMKAATAIGRQAEAEQRVNVRLLRQRRLEEIAPLQLSVVVGETALLSRVGGSDTHRAQLRHLLELIDRHPETLDLRVIPLDEGVAISGINSATFHLLSFSSARLPTVGWLETAISGDFVERHAQVNELEYLYGQMRSFALDREDTGRLIERTAANIENVG